MHQNTAVALSRSNPTVALFSFANTQEWYSDQTYLHGFPVRKVGMKHGKESIDERVIVGVAMSQREEPSSEDVVVQGPLGDPRCDCALEMQRACNTGFK